MRVKRGVPGHAKHVKIRKATRGFSHPNRVSVKRGRQALVKSMQFATRDRKNRKRTFRELWITRINAAAHLNDTTYSKLIAALKVAGITIDRKILAELAVNDPAAFTAVVKATQK
ncbi:50S ribosomal protein L20 [Aeromicrobium sp.]|nr:50S ribosomal protein L20 [Candidatus Saccharibacteria bacterium]